MSVEVWSIQKKPKKFSCEGESESVSQSVMSELRIPRADGVEDQRMFARVGSPWSFTNRPSSVVFM